MDIVEDKINMECKIFCFYNNKDYEEILKKISNDDSFDVITDDKNMKEFLKTKNRNTVTLEEYFSNYSKNIFEIYKNSKTSIQKYENDCKKIKYNEIEIIQGLTHYLINDIIFFEKIKMILMKKSNVLFIFKNFRFVYFSILEYVMKMGYQINEKNSIILVKDGQSRILNSEEDYGFLERSSTISKYKNYFSLYSKNISGNNSKTKSIGQIKALMKLIPVATRLISLKLKKTSKIESVEPILEKIREKISNIKTSEYGFFLSSDRDDAFEPHDLLIKKLEFKKSFSIFTIDPISSSFLEKRNLSHVDFFEETILLENILKNSKEGDRMKNEIINLCNEKDLVILFNNKFNQSVLNGIFRSIAIYIVMDEVIKKTHLKKCIIMNGPIISKTVSVLAKKYHIPTISIESVLVDNNELSSIVYDADKICIYGNQGKKVLRDFGLDEKRIVVTGNPKYDYFKSIDKHKVRKKLCSSLKINLNKKIIVIALSRWHRNDEEWISKFIQFCNNKNYEIIIKLHPRYKINSEEIKNEVKFINDKCKEQKFYIIYDMKINDLILGSDLVISDFSNVAVEAILLDKSVINVNFLKEELTDLQNFHEFGASLYTEDYDTLEKMIVNIFKDNYFEEERIQGRQKIIKLFNYQNDGNATDRIFDVLQE